MLRREAAASPDAMVDEILTAGDRETTFDADELLD